jgi:pimeloyl-ACP methyl ester carboxylesterase
VPAGGFLACNLAARHPDAVKGLVLLNATPFWSSRPPTGQEGLLWRLMPSTVPVPKVCVCRYHFYFAHVTLLRQRRWLSSINGASAQGVFYPSKAIVRAMLSS